MHGKSALLADRLGSGVRYIEDYSISIGELDEVKLSITCYCSHSEAFTLMSAFFIDSHKALLGPFTYKGHH
jgi:hypothetical protein